jgi:hypothetical protein
MNTANLLGPKAIKRIAIAYNRYADQLPVIPKNRILRIRRLIEDQFAYLVWELHLDIRFTEEDPYDYKSGLDDLLDDYYTEKLIRVNTSGNESKFWGPFYNLAFRAVHDFIHASNQRGFTYEDEIKAFEDQLKFYPYPLLDQEDLDLYEKVLRSEIIYQAAFKTHFGLLHVPHQKIILSDL